jgi:uncharacterized protein (TIGR02996 family)
VTYEDCMLAILANPEDDAPRHELANVLRSSDPERAEFVEAQLALSDHERQTKYGPHGPRPGRADLLLRQNEQLWSRDLGFTWARLRSIASLSSIAGCHGSAV